MNAKDAGADLRQAQFLKVQSRDEAIAAFTAALRPKPLGVEHVSLERLVGRILAEDLRAPVDAPPFDRSVVDGFAVSAADLSAASQGRPVRLSLNGETIHCGHHPALAVAAGERRRRSPPADRSRAAPTPW